MLDARNPQSGKDVSSAPEEETERELENEISRLQHETRLWRLSCSAFWAMWGVQRAKIPDLPDFDDPTQSAAVAAGPTLNISMSSGTLPLVQSPIAEEDGLELDADTSKATEGSADTPAAATKNAEAQSNEEDEEEEDEFDYLGYSYDRAMFFWGDAVNLGLVKKHELPEEVQKNMRLVDV
jgi:choline kinase